MSVPKSEQTESKFEVLYNATKVHDELEVLAFRSFGIYSKNSILRKRYQNMIANFKNEEYLDLVIQGYKDQLVRSALMMETHLRQAKSINPFTEPRLELREKYQQLAIDECNAIKSLLCSIARVFNVDLNFFEIPNDLVNREIDLIKKWRRSDSRRFKNREKIR